MNHKMKPYQGLTFMVIISFISMYILMYSMVNAFGNVYSSFNQIYMAGLMTAPMVLIELVLMGPMYPDKKLNTGIMIGSVVTLVMFFTLIRQQVAISDNQFLRSMIPHHAGAILMCEKSSIVDPEIKELCRTIVSGQQNEIDLMKRKLSKPNA